MTELRLLSLVGAPELPTVIAQHELDSLLLYNLWISSSYFLNWKVCFPTWVFRDLSLSLNWGLAVYRLRILKCNLWKLGHRFISITCISPYTIFTYNSQSLRLQCQNLTDLTREIYSFIVQRPDIQNQRAEITFPEAVRGASFPLVPIRVPWLTEVILQSCSNITTFLYVSVFTWHFPHASFLHGETSHIGLGPTLSTGLTVNWLCM